MDTTERLHFHFHALEKEMATHPSVLTWRIPGTGEPGWLQSMGNELDTTVGLIRSDLILKIYLKLTIPHYSFSSPPYRLLSTWYSYKMNIYLKDQFLLSKQIKNRKQNSQVNQSPRQQWHPTPVLLAGKSHGRRSLVGCSPWGREESDTSE